MSLGTTYPQFRFAYPADAFIEKSRGTSILSQLQERRITLVKIEPLFSSGGLGIGSDGNFSVSLNEDSTIPEQAYSLGHEIGHTFHHNLTKIPPENILPGEYRVHVEDFCDDFALAWLVDKDPEKVMYAIKHPIGLQLH